LDSKRPDELVQLHRDRAVSKNLAAFLLVVAIGVCSAPASLHARSRDPWLARDKLLHFGATAAIAASGYGLSRWWLDDERQRLAAAAGLAMSAGVAKELYDLSGHGDPSWRDLTWDAAGAACGSLSAWLVGELWWRLTAPPASPNPP
jgi:uncharacterized protein YfiM (DUF2279 family)